MKSITLACCILLGNWMHCQAEEISSDQILVLALDRLNEVPWDTVNYLNQYGEHLVAIPMPSGPQFGILMGLCGGGAGSRQVALPRTLWRNPERLDIRCLKVGNCSSLAAVECLNNVQDQLFLSNLEIEQRLVQVLEKFLKVASTTTTTETPGTERAVKDLFAEIDGIPIMNLVRDGLDKKENGLQDDFVTKEELDKVLTVEKSRFYTGISINLVVIASMACLLMFCFCWAQRRDAARLRERPEAEAQVIRNLAETREKYLRASNHHSEVRFDTVRHVNKVCNWLQRPLKAAKVKKWFFTILAYF